MDSAKELANTMIKKAPIAIRIAKKCINKELTMTIDAAIAEENEDFGYCFTTKDQKEGMSAFLEKRDPVFKNK